METDFRSTMYTVDTKGHRKWVYPTIINGALRFKRRIVAGFLIALYLAMPWIVIGEEQAVHLDLIHRRFTFFGFIFHATDTLYLFLLLGTAAFSLFFFTAVLGRVWCGWGCPQTVFLEFVFRPLERLIEGSVGDRRRLDAAPWGSRKIALKGIKLGVFSLVAWILSSTFLAYFVGREELLSMMRGSPAAHPQLFGATLLFMGALIFQFGWFREQFCSVLCPYARFQSVLLDRDSIAVAYDTKRGEPRGKAGKAEGDCVDCGLCVRACPTGIDIRNGLQLECVQCTSCIDACNDVMVKIGRAPGLIKYSTERMLEGSPYRLFRPRIILYAVILVAYITTFSLKLASRPEGEFELIRATGDAPFVEDASGVVTNHYKLHLANRGREGARFSAHLVDATGSDVMLPGSPYLLGADSEIDLPLFFRFPKDILHGGRAVLRLEVLKNDTSIGIKNVPVIGPDL